jgi:uncharacterized membrane protein YgdD (TMEM256/DUF423 family)
MRFAVIGAASGFLAVALGAFAAHGLRDRLSPTLLDTFEVAVRYQMYHSLALFVVAWLSQCGSQRVVTWSGIAFVSGLVLFSGSLYAYVLSEQRVFALITPLGGLCFLLGWVLLGSGAFKSRGA